MNLFDLISRPYAAFYPYQVKQFRGIVPTILHAMTDHCVSVLDIGCGTGALCQVLMENGLQTEGCDRSAQMIKQAKRLSSPEITYTLADSSAGLAYADQSFDLVTASMVAHGLKHEQRVKLYAEMCRIARKTVVIIDYGPKRNFVSDILETLEQGDYFSFIKVVDQELKEFFGNLTKIPLSQSIVAYVMYIR